MYICMCIYIYIYIYIYICVCVGFLVDPGTLVPGDLCDGDVLRLIVRPCPDWTLARVSSLLYGNRKAIGA